MGVYDSVMIPCPKCGKTQEAQSKSGPCILNVYELEDAPIEVLMNVNRHAPFKCDDCGCYYMVRLKTTALTEVVDEKLLKQIFYNDLPYR
jgi:predicted RNA-binding Zn-ribbon protein involved in translation (DUF1610 family)